MKHKLQAAFDAPGITCVISPVLSPEDRAVLPRRPPHIRHVEAATIADALREVFPGKRTLTSCHGLGYRRDGLLALCDSPDDQLIHACVWVMFTGPLAVGAAPNLATLPTTLIDVDERDRAPSRVEVAIVPGTGQVRACAGAVDAMLPANHTRSTHLPVLKRFYYGVAKSRPFFPM